MPTFYKDTEILVMCLKSLERYSCTVYNPIGEVYCSLSLSCTISTLCRSPLGLQMAPLNSCEIGKLGEGVLGLTLKVLVTKVDALGRF